MYTGSVLTAAAPASSVPVLLCELVDIIILLLIITISSSSQTCEMMRAPSTPSVLHIYMYIFLFFATKIYDRDCLSPAA